MQRAIYQDSWSIAIYLHPKIMKIIRDFVRHLSWSLFLAHRINIHFSMVFLIFRRFSSLTCVLLFWSLLLFYAHKLGRILYYYVCVSGVFSMRLRERLDLRFYVRLWCDVRSSMSLARSVIVFILIVRLYRWSMTFGILCNLVVIIRLSSIIMVG